MLIVYVVVGLLVGIVLLRQGMRMASKRDLGPVSEQWLLEQRVRD